MKSLDVFDKILGWISLIICTALAVLCAYWMGKNNSALPIPLIVACVIGCVISYRELIKKKQTWLFFGSFMPQDVLLVLYFQYEHKLKKSLY